MPAQPRRTPAALAILLLATAAAAQPPAAGQPPAAVPPAAPAPPGSDITVTGRNVLDLTPLVGGADYIDPMGEPYHSPDKLSGAEHWFRRLDTDNNGRITPAEFKVAADRFFASLDQDHNDVIEPDELQRYETEIAPEIHVTNTWGDMSKATTDSDGKVVMPPYPTRLGAARYAYLTFPNPVTYADTNLDRGVTRLEWKQAGDKRFKALDANGDGTITRQELPRLVSPDRAGQR